MRLEKRIPLYYDLIDFNKVIEYILPNLEDLEKKELTDNINEEESKDLILNYWLENPDQRFTQVLVNTGLIPNYPGFWYYVEETDILEKQGINPREYIFWGVNYTKDMERLPNTKWTLLKDLKSDHIEAIIDGDFTKDLMLDFMKNELKSREC